MVPFCNFEMNNTAVTHIWFKFTVGGSVSERGFLRLLFTDFKGSLVLVRNPRQNCGQSGVHLP